MPGPARMTRKRRHAGWFAYAARSPASISSPAPIPAILTYPPNGTAEMAHSVAALQEDGAEADAEALDAHPAQASDGEVAELVDDDERAEREDDDQRDEGVARGGAEEVRHRRFLSTWRRPGSSDSPRSPFVLPSGSSASLRISGLAALRFASPQSGGSERRSPRPPPRRLAPFAIRAAERFIGES